MISCTESSQQLCKLVIPAFIFSPENRVLVRLIDKPKATRLVNARANIST